MGSAPREMSRLLNWASKLSNPTLISPKVTNRRLLQLLFKEQKVSSLKSFYELH